MPPHGQQAYGVGLGFQGAPGAFPPMQGTVPGQAGGATLPPPDPRCGRLGVVCWNAGPVDVVRAATETLTRWAAATPANNFDSDAWVDLVSHSLTPYVLLTIDPFDGRCQTLFNLIRVKDGPPGIKGKVFAFRGDGEKPVAESFVMAGHDARADLGGARRERVLPLQDLFVWSQNPMGGAQGALAPHVDATTPGAEEVATTVHLPLANAFVHIFGDRPTPFVGILRMIQLGPVVPANVLVGIINFLRSACHVKSATNGTSRHARDWIVVSSADPQVQSWAQRMHDALIPPPPAPSPPQQQQEPALDPRQIVREELERQQGSRDTQRARGRMPNAREWTAYQFWTGIDEDFTITSDICPPFIKWWSKTPNNVPALREMWSALLDESAKALNRTRYITYVRAYFFNDCLKGLQMGGDFGTSFEQCHKGFSCAAVWSLMAGSDSESAIWEARETALLSATLVNEADVLFLAGTPKRAPDTVEELLTLLEEFIIWCHAFGYYNGAHCKKVRSLEKLIKKRKRTGHLEPHVVDIYWQMFRDSRHCFATKTEAPTSLLDGVEADIVRGRFAPSIGVPYEKLSGSAEPPTKRPRISAPTSTSGGDGGAGKPGKAYGPLKFPSRMIQEAWRKIEDDFGKKTRMRDVVRFANDPSGAPYTTNTFIPLFSGCCATGFIYGQCTKVSCKHEHEKPLPADKERIIVDVLNKGREGKKAGGAVS